MPPALPRILIRRPYLERVAAEAVHAGGTILYVSSPPGYEKTGFLSLADTLWNKRVAWIFLDRFDNDPESFYGYFRYALEEGGIIGEAKDYRSAVREKKYGFLSLLHDIEITDEPMLLVLENLHEIDNPEIMDDLGIFIKYLQKNCTLPVSTRAE